MHLCNCGCGAQVQKRFARGHNSKKPLESVESRFWKYVIQSDGCWIWSASKNGHGYGQLRDHIQKKPVLATRVSFSIHNGRIPDGMCVLHRCDNPPCVNPAHLFLGTMHDNSIDMGRKFRTRSNLSLEDVLAIREAKGKYRDVAAQFGLKSHKSVANIKQRRTFAYA